MLSRALLVMMLFLPSMKLGGSAMAREIDVGALFVQAEADGRAGVARKVKPVEARPAIAGEIVVTHIKGEGKETQSKPAKAGDMVVRNRCHETGNEEILVSATKFADRYDGPIAEDPANTVEAGWKAYRPRGNDMKFFTVRTQDGSFTFVAPWGELMVAKPGDVIVRDPDDKKDTYRIARAAFVCTYEIIKAPHKS